MEVHFYTRKRCPLCDEARVLLDLFQNEYFLNIVEHDIEQDDELLEMYQLKIPVIVLNGDELDGNQINYDSLEQLFKKHA